MSQRSVRGWYVAAGLLLIAVLAVGTVLYLNSRRALDPAALASYFPERDGALFYADIRAIRNSGILAKLVGSSVGEEPDYKTFVARTGFDYKRDLDRALGSSAGATTYLLLEGRFDWSKMRAYVTEQGGSCQGDYCSVSGTTQGKVLSFYPIRSDLMAFASAPDSSAARAIQARSPRKLPFDIPQQPIWVSLPAAIIRGQQAQAPSGAKLFAKALESSDRALLTIGPKGKDFEVVMEVWCPREEDAVVLKHQLEALTKLLQSFLAREQKSPNQRDLSGVLTAGVFERSGSRVTARWPLSREFVDSLGGS